MARSGRSTVKDAISPRELLALLAGGSEPLLLDVRDPAELRGPNGAIRGATNIPLRKLGPAVPRLLAKREREVVTICNTGQPDGRAAAAAHLLTSAGAERVRRLYGGMVAWNHLNAGRKARSRRSRGGRASPSPGGRVS